MKLKLSNILLPLGVTLLLSACGGSSTEQPVRNSEQAAVTAVTRPTKGAAVPPGAGSTEAAVEPALNSPYQRHPARPQPRQPSWNPISSLSQQGLPQINTNHWATGDNHGQTLLQWNHLQILPHYYTGIHLSNASSQGLTPDYRWNPLVVDWGNGATQPPAMQSGTTYNVTIHLQNTGAVNWGSDVSLSCRWQKPDGSFVACETSAQPGLYSHN